MIANGNNYFTRGNYTVYEIGAIYCTNPPPPSWANAVTNNMKEIYSAAGKELTIGNSEAGNKIVQLATTKIGCTYTQAQGLRTGPNSFDCSGLVYWCYQQVGISVPMTTAAYKSWSAYQVSLSELQPGDVLHRYAGEFGKKDGHAAIYIGNGQYIHAAGKKYGVIKGSSIKGSFARAYRFL